MRGFAGMQGFAIIETARYTSQLFDSALADVGAM